MQRLGHLDSVKLLHGWQNWKLGYPRKDNKCQRDNMRLPMCYKELLRTRNSIRRVGNMGVIKYSTYSTTSAPPKGIEHSLINL